LPSLLVASLPFSKEQDAAAPLIQCSHREKHPRAGLLLLQGRKIRGEYHASIIGGMAETYNAPVYSSDGAAIRI
jgi:hypothetical protein